MTDSWVDKHRPENWGDLQGNNKAIDQIKDWARNWSHGDTPQLLVGEPGTGKTSTAEVVANKLNLQVDSINASSARKTDDIKEIAASIRTQDPDGGHKLVLLDEVDSWHHAADKRPLYDALDAPANPVILTANDEYDTPDGVTSRVDVHEFKLGKRSRKAKLKKVAEAEDVDLSDKDLDLLADRPDLRSAINDLQIAAESDIPVSTDDRDWELSEWDMVDQMLTGTADTGDISPADALLWLDENVKHEYRGLELAYAYEALSRADVYLGMAQTSGDYRYWRYAGALVEEVAKVRRTEPYYDDHVGRSKSFPEWFRHSEPSATGEDSTAKLYRALKNYDDGAFGFSGDFGHFREVILPQLQALPDDDRYQLILDHGLDPDEYDALDVTESQYENWMEQEAPETGEWGGATNVAEW